MAGKYTQLQDPEIEFSHAIDITSVQGNIGPQTEQPKIENTLDEPIKVTIVTITNKDERCNQHMEQDSACVRSSSNQ